MYLGSFIIDDTCTLYCNAHTPSTGAAVDADAVPGYRIYEDETGTPILTGSYALLDDANTVGFYSEQITLSAANGFEAGKSYGVRTTIVVGAVTGTQIDRLQIGARVDTRLWNGLATVALPLIPTTAGRTLDVSAGGEAGLDWANIGSPTTAQNLSATNIDVDQIVASVSGAVGSVTGAVGSVTGLTASNLDATVSSRATPAQVNTEVLDVLNVDTFAQPGQETPAATTTIRLMLNYLYKAWRNRTTQTATQYSLFNDDAATVDQKATYSNDGVTAARGEVATGP